MTSVSRKDGFRYGFYVFAYWLVLLGFSAALVVAGGYIVEMQNLGDVGLNEDSALAVLGGFVTLLGVLVFGSGQVGLVYKVIADGVSVGSVAGHREGSAPVADSAVAPTEAGTRTDESEGTPTASAEATRDAAETADERGGEQGQTDRRTDEPEPGRPRQRPRQSAAADEQSPAGDEPATGTGDSPPDRGEPATGTGDSPPDRGEPATGTGEPTTGTGEPAHDTGETPPPRETSSRPRASSRGQADERAADAKQSDDGPSDAERAGRSGSESASDRRERPAENPGETATSERDPTTPDDQPERTEQRPGGQRDRQRAGTGDGTSGDGATDDDRDSPVDAVNESEIAEELGFGEADEQASERRDENSGGQAGGAGEVHEGERTDGQTSRDVETAETVIDADAGETEGDADNGVETEADTEASALDWGGSETTSGSSDTGSADTGSETPDRDEPEPGSGTGTGSLADALADEDDSAEGETATGDGDDDAGDADDADDAESPRWTTGEDHEGGPGQGER